MLQYEPKLLHMILIVRFFILFFLNQFLTDVELEEPGKCYNMNQGVRGCIKIGTYSLLVRLSFLVTGRTHPYTVPRSTQPSTLRETVT